MVGFKLPGLTRGGSPGNAKGKKAWFSILKKSDKYSDLAGKAYWDGDFQKGSYYERKADDIYAKNYYKYVKFTYEGKRIK